MSGGEGLAADPLAALRSQPSRPVKIDFSDGESVIATEITFLEDEGLVWYRLLSSNRPAKYESLDEPYLHSANLSEIMRSTLATSELD